MARTESTNYWSGLRDDLSAVGIDILRDRFIDSERLDDGTAVTDEAAFRAGFTGRETFQTAPGGVPLSTWALIAAALTAGVIVLKKFV